MLSDIPQEYILTDWELIKKALIYLSIPLISGLIGWLTNWMALLLTFYPLEYVGLRPFGWQGIIPAKAQKMAEKSVDMLTSKLLRIDELFEKLQTEALISILKDEITILNVKIIDEAMEAQVGAIWSNLPTSLRNQLYERVDQEVPFIIHNIMQELQHQISQLLDVKRITIQKFITDKGLNNEIFQRCGAQEFKFIERSGFWFGSLFGMIQMVTAYFFPTGSWWILPSFGLLVGYLTNSLALKLIFEPMEPRSFLGFTFQGLFLKRQKEVAEEYANAVTEKILDTKTMVKYLAQGPASAQTQQIITKEIHLLVDTILEERTGAYLPLFTALVGERLRVFKNIVSFRFEKEIPLLVMRSLDYIEKTIDLKNTLAIKMASLSSKEFEKFLRPVFQEDEWILILVGAMLGMIAGIIQYIVMWYFNFA